MARDEETEDIQVEVEREETPREQPPAREKLHPNTCPVCKSHYREDELRAVLRVCTVCGHHFPVGAEERVEQLADPGSFRPLAEGLRSADPLAFTDLRPYTERLTEAEVATGLGDALIAGTATVGGMPCVLCTMDFSFMGGSMGSVVGEKVARAAEAALERRIPLVIVSASGGARMQEGTLSLMQLAKTCAAIGRLAEAGVPYISLMTDPTTGGTFASFAVLGDVNIAEPKALIGFAGARVAAGTIAEELPEGFQRSEFLFEHGFVDLVVTRAHLRETMVGLLRYLRASVRAEKVAGNGSAPVGRSPAFLDSLINREPIHG